MLNERSTQQQIDQLQPYLPHDISSEVQLLYGYSSQIFQDQNPEIGICRAVPNHILGALIARGAAELHQGYIDTHGEIPDHIQNPYQVIRSMPLRVRMPISTGLYGNYRQANIAADTVFVTRIPNRLDQFGLSLTGPTAGLIVRTARDQSDNSEFMTVGRVWNDEIVQHSQMHRPYPPYIEDWNARPALTEIWREVVGNYWQEGRSKADVLFQLLKENNLSVDRQSFMYTRWNNDKRVRLAA